MTTAVLISGQTRSFTHCLNTQHHHVFRHLIDPYFFCSVADDAQAAEIYLLEGLYPGKVFVERVAQPELTIPGEAQPASCDVALSQRHRLSIYAPYAISGSHQAILRQLWHLNRVWEFCWVKADEIKREGKTFDAFIRIRPDLRFKSCDDFATAEYPGPACFVPWWACCGGINDRFAIMGAEAAQHYFGTWRKLGAMLEAGIPLHPESLIAESLRLGVCNVRKTLQAVFSTLRMDGSEQEPIAYFGEREALLVASR